MLPASATVVPEHERLRFLPRIYGTDHALYETAVFNHAAALITGYTGGYWEFVQTPTTGFMLLDIAGPVTVTSPNGYRAVTSPLVASLAVCTFAASSVMWTYQSRTNVERWDALKDWVFDNLNDTDSMTYAQLID